MSNRLAWLSPLDLELRATDDSESFRTMPPHATGLPVGAHPGAFGVTRRNHVHEGVDLYAPEATPVLAVEDGVVVAVMPFTGPSAEFPWWLDTMVVLVEGASGVVAYGEGLSPRRFRRPRAAWPALGAGGASAPARQGAPDIDASP